MTRVGDTSGPLPSAPVDAPPANAPTEQRQTPAVPLSTPLGPANVASAPPPVVSKQALTAWTHELRGLQTLSERLVRDLQIHNVRTDGALEYALGALSTAGSRFSPVHAAERAMCETLKQWASDAQAESPSVTAESLVKAQFPDHMSASHGAFKALARAMDKAIAGRSAESERDAQLRGAMLGQLADVQNPAEKEGKGVGLAVSALVGLAAPPIGVALALRDLAGLVRQKRRGEDVSDLDIAQEGAAAFPVLRVGGVVLRATPAAIAEAGELTKISRAGLQKIAETAGPQVATHLRLALQELMVLRTELLVRLEAVIADPATGRTARESLTKTINSMNENGKVDDVVGALRDLRGVPVWDAFKARNFDHLQEVMKHTEALTNARVILVNQSRRANQILLLIVDDLNTYKRSVVGLLEKAK